MRRWWLAAAALCAAHVPAAHGQAPCTGIPPCLCPTSATFGTCNTLTGKLPRVTGGGVGGTTMPAGPSMETGVRNRTRFEHSIGHALRSAKAVQHATREFGERIWHAFLEPVAAGPQRDAAVERAFAARGFDQSNTGWVGTDSGVIEQVLRTGNIREVWALVYALTKTAFVDSAVLTADGAVIAADELERRGLAAAPLRKRASLVAATTAAAAAYHGVFPSYDQGVPDLAFPGFDSWVRFDYNATGLSGTPRVSGHAFPLWTQARTWVDGRTTLMSDDPSIDPPLSNAELDYQCAITEDHCRLHWTPGLLGYALPTVSFSETQSASEPGYVPGYRDRAMALGYRVVAGPSGTAANVLQYGTYLGMEGDWLPLLRLTMLAWMLPTDDHSLYEIMLGAEPYMTEGFHMAQSMEDLGRLCPPERDLRIPSLPGKLQTSNRLQIAFKSPNLPS